MGIWLVKRGNRNNTGNRCWDSTEKCLISPLISVNESERVVKSYRFVSEIRLFLVESGHWTRKCLVHALFVALWNASGLFQIHCKHNHTDHIWTVFHLYGSFYGLWGLWTFWMLYHNIRIGTVAQRCDMSCVLSDWRMNKTIFHILNVLSQINWTQARIIELIAMK